MDAMGNLFQPKPLHWSLRLGLRLQWFRVLKCRLVGHAPMGFRLDRPSPPGFHFCGRCDRLVRPKQEPMTQAHVDILIKNGWPEALARTLLKVPL